MSEIPLDSDSDFEEGLSGEGENVSKPDENEKGGGEVVAGDSEPEPYETISETLEEGERRQEEEAERTKTPPPKGDEEGRVFGLTHAYYRDLQRQTGGLSIKVLMDNQGWDRERADIAMGLLRKAGVVE